MKFAPLILLFLVGCEAAVHVDGKAPQAAPTIQAAPVQQFGHISPIQLPAGEYWDGWLAIPEVWSSPGWGEYRKQPEKYFFSTIRGIRAFGSHGTHTLRDGQGIPVLIVKDPD